MQSSQLNSQIQPEESNIQSALNRLFQNLETLSATVDMLPSTLSQILGPHEPAKETSSLKPMRTQCQHADTLDEATEKLREMTMKLQVINTRIEL